MAWSSPVPSDSNGASKPAPLHFGNEPWQCSNRNHRKRPGRSQNGPHQILRVNTTGESPNSYSGFTLPDMGEMTGMADGTVPVELLVQRIVQPDGCALGEPMCVRIPFWRGSFLATGPHIAALLPVERFGESWCAEGARDRDTARDAGIPRVALQM